MAELIFKLAIRRCLQGSVSIQTALLTVLARMGWDLLSQILEASLYSLQMVSSGRDRQEEQNWSY